YRGIPIEQLAEKSDFVETAWLLIFGRLPNTVELDRFRGLLSKHAELHEGFKDHCNSFPVDAPPMAMLGSMVNTLCCYYPQLITSDDSTKLEEAAARLMAKVPTLAAYIYRRSHQSPYVAPDPKLKYVENFMHMMFSTDDKRHDTPDEVEQA